MGFLKKRLIIIVSAIIVLAGLAFAYLYFNGYISAATNTNVIDGKVSNSTLILNSTQKINLGFTLGKTSQVKVYVVDSQKKQVKELYYSNTALNIGSYDQTKIPSLVWDGKNSSGQSVAAGNYSVYFDARSKFRLYARDMESVTVSAVSTAITVDPASFNPSNNETANVKANIPVAGTYRLAVKDSTGKIVKILADFASVQVGDYTRTWDGKDANGAVVAAGEYVAENDQKQADSSIVSRGNAKIIVSSGAVTPPPTVSSEFGNLVEGTFSANFNWLANSGYKYGITFTAEKTGQIKAINMQWKSGGSYGYGAGTWTNPSTGQTAHSVTQAKQQHGVYKVEIQANGTGNFPSGQALASTANIYPEDALALASGRTITDSDNEQCTCDGSFQVNFATPASVEAGKIYHLVVTNTVGTPSTNWSSPNTLATRINTGTWTGGKNRAEYWDGSKWYPWTTQKNSYQTGTPNNNLDGSHAPILVHWVDGTYSGGPYYSAASQNRHPQLYGTNKMGEKIVWTGENTTISKIGITVYKQGTGTPAGELKYHIDMPDGTTQTGTLVTGANVTTIPEWKYATVTPFTLEKGKTYKIWFDSANSTSAAYYAQDPVYGQGIPSLWLDYTWGGTASRAFVNASEYSDMDLSLSLQK